MTDGREDPSETSPFLTSSGKPAEGELERQGHQSASSARHELIYANAELRTSPWWIHGLALLGWFFLIVIVYGGTISGFLGTVIATALLLHSHDALRAFGEPLVTTWQHVRLILWNATILLVFGTAMTFLRRWMRKSVH